MLENVSPLKQTALGSRLAGTSALRPKAGSGGRRSIVTSLMLTSLVDAFSILVIFLIMNHSASSDVVNLGDKLVLPQAKESDAMSSGVVVRLENGKLMVDEKEVAQENLIATLKALNSSVAVARREGLIIVADRNMDYSALSPVILAGSQAGFTKYKFAVVRK